MVEWLTLCLGSQPWVEECSIGRGFHRCALVPMILCREKLRIEQVFHFSGKEGCAGSSQTKESRL